MDPDRSIAARCLRGFKVPDDSTYSIVTPLVRSAPFRFESTKELVDFLEERGKRRQPEYGRMGNPTVQATADRIAGLENAEAALLFSSGMAAITTLMFTYLKAGSHVVITEDCYKRTRDFASDFLGKFGVDCSVVDVSLETIQSAITDRTEMVFTETPTNPYLKVVDVEGLAELSRKHGFLSVVDSTFATPVNLRPLDYGIDIVVHSCTKYLGGHNDLIAGVIAGDTDLIEPVSELLSTLGAICDPDSAYLLERGIKTLELRVRCQNRNGQAVAEYLKSHPRVEKVFYPGLESHPQRGIAVDQMSGYGGVVTFLVDTDFDGTARFIDSLQIPQIAPSLGGVESLVEPVAAMGYWDMPADERRALGIHDSLVRLSLGIEDENELIEDLKRALKAIDG